MQALSRFEPRLGRTAPGAALVLAVLAFLAFATHASAEVAPSSCPPFRVLHDDRIGPAVLPAGSYELRIESSGLGCASAAQIFARFLADYDGVLPKPWKLVNEGSGKASFTRGETLPGFSVTLGEEPEGGGGNPAVGRLCPGTFTVESTTTVASTRFGKGKYLIYVPDESRVSCKGAAALFTRFLGAGGKLPPPWKLLNQTATFYKSSDASGSAFRVEPLAGSVRR